MNLEKQKQLKELERQVQEEAGNLNARTVLALEIIADSVKVLAAGSTSIKVTALEKTIAEQEVTIADQQAENADITSQLANANEIIDEHLANAIDQKTELAERVKSRGGASDPAFQLRLDLETAQKNLRKTQTELAEARVKADMWCLVSEIIKVCHVKPTLPQNEAIHAVQVGWQAQKGNEKTWEAALEQYHNISHQRAENEAELPEIDKDMSGIDQLYLSWKEENQKRLIAEEKLHVETKIKNVHLAGMATLRQQLAKTQYKLRETEKARDTAKAQWESCKQSAEANADALDHWKGKERLAREDRDACKADAQKHQKRVTELESQLGTANINRQEAERSRDELKERLETLKANADKLGLAEVKALQKQLDGAKATVRTLKAEVHQLKATRTTSEEEHADDNG